MKAEFRSGFVGAMFGGIMLVGAAGVGAYFWHDTFKSDPTDQEAALAGAAAKLIGEDIKVRCVTPGQMGRRTWGNQESAGASLPYMNTVWLADASCDAITAFAADLPTSKQLKKVGDAKGRERAVQVAALHALAFQAARANGTFGREDAQCDAVASVGQLAMAFGLKESLADNVQAADRVIWTKGVEGNPPPAGFELHGCA